MSTANNPPLLRDISTLTIAQMRHAIDVERDLAFAAPEVQLMVFKERIAEALSCGSRPALAGSPELLEALYKIGRIADDPGFAHYSAAARVQDMKRVAANAVRAALSGDQGATGDRSRMSTNGGEK